MRRRRRRCIICKETFDPIHRLGCRQVTCRSESCRRERKRRYDSHWHRRNRDLHNQMVADWFRDHRKLRCDYMRRRRQGLRPPALKDCFAVTKVLISDNSLTDQGKVPCNKSSDGPKAAGHAGKAPWTHTSGPKSEGFILSKEKRRKRSPAG